MIVERASEIGFCFGVRRAIDILETAVRKRGEVETLGAAVHNQQVLQRLAEMGVRVADSIGDVQGDTVVISAHGANPQLEEEIRARHLQVIDATCPIVRRAQVVARELAEADSLVIIYGDINHPEVKGILGWANSRGVVALDEEFTATIGHPPSSLGVLSQTTQIPAHFSEFVKKLSESALLKCSELRVIDTICQEIKKRQASALELAERVDLMLVIGGHNSANTNRLAELCSTVTKTYLIEVVGEIKPSWLQGKSRIGVAGGTSTAEQVIHEVVTSLEALA